MKYCALPRARFTGGIVSPIKSDIQSKQGNLF